MTIRLHTEQHKKQVSYFLELYNSEKDKSVLMQIDAEGFYKTQQAFHIYYERNVRIGAIKNYYRTYEDADKSYHNPKAIPGTEWEYGKQEIEIY